MEVDSNNGSHEPDRNPTWFSPDDAKNILAKGREVKYAKEMQAVIDRALQHLGAAKAMTAQ